MTKVWVPAWVSAQRPSRPRGWLLAAAGLVALAVWIYFVSAENVKHPNGYIARHGWDVAKQGPWPVKYEEVRELGSVMAVEAALAIWILAARLRASLARRALLLGGGFFSILLLMGVGGMHASSPFVEHLMWLLLASLWLLLVAAVAAVAAVRARRRARRAPLAPDEPEELL